jgi:hypothetical protein
MEHGKVYPLIMDHWRRCSDRINESFIAWKDSIRGACSTYHEYRSWKWVDVQKWGRVYLDTVLQSSYRFQALMNDSEKRTILLQKLKERKLIRLYVKKIIFVVPFLLIFILGNLYFYHQKYNDPIDATMIRTNAPLWDHPPVIDIISVGSLLKEEYQKAQLRTFGTHITVRNFYRITERNDTDSTCFTTLSSAQLDAIVHFCANTEEESFISTTLRKQLFQPKKHTGWMCAQKRPLDGLYQVLKQYESAYPTSLNQTSESGTTMNLPDYLFIIDDDTYLNMDPLTADLVKYHPSNLPFAVAGCNFNSLKESGITYPLGGYGAFLSKAAIQRLLQPIYCDSNNEKSKEDHSVLNCWRMKFNAIGERQFFVEGMSVAELMQTYAAQLPFTGVKSWEKTGYCLHSDHALAFFINFYHVPVPDGIFEQFGHPKDRIRRRHSFMQLQGRDKETECEHAGDTCSQDHRVCHRVQPKQMDQLYNRTVQTTALSI